MSILSKKVVLAVAFAALVWVAGSWTASAAEAKEGAPDNRAAGAQKSGASIDLNSASEKDLDSLPGVGPATAKKIISGRPYSSVSDLSKAGISAAEIKKITALVTVGSGAAAPATAARTAPPPSAAAVNAAPPAPAPSRSAASANQGGTGVAAAPAGNGMVWVNLDSGIYHYQGTQYYGKTKNGKYLSEADAEKAGYRAAKNEKRPQ